MKQLEMELRRQAAAIPAEAPSGLERRIGAAIRCAVRTEAGEDPMTPEAAWARPWVMRSALAGLGFAAFAAAIALYVRVKPPASDPVALHADAAALAQTVTAMPGRLWTAVKPAAAAALQRDPLQAEAAALKSDAQSALGFLAYNFLPQSGGAKSG